MSLPPQVKKQAAIMMAAAMSVCASATVIDGIDYNLNNETHTAIVSTENQLASGDIKIPSQVTYETDTYTVEALAQYAFSNNKDITSVTLPSTITTVSQYTFEECSALATVNLGESITEIADFAFKGCSALTAISLPEGLHTIGRGTFLGCGLTAVKLPSTITTISEQAFDGCSALATVNLDESPITEIADFAFNKCSALTAISLPASLLTIGLEAFRGCGLKEIRIPAATNSISYGAFWDCIDMERIEVSTDNATYASFDEALYDKNLEKSVLCPQGKSSVTLPPTLTEITGQSFRNCKKLTSVEFPASLKSIGGQSFLGCSSLTSVSIPDGVTTALAYAFQGCTSLRSATISNSITKLENLFDGCTSLTSVKIGSSVEELDNYSFRGCKALKSITLPASLKLIGAYAFFNCSSLTDVWCMALTPPTVDTSAFDTGTQITLHVPASAKDEYAKAPVWANFTSVVAGVDEVTTDTPERHFTVIGGRIVTDDTIHTDIYNAAGVKVFSGTGLDVTLPAGLYIVAAGSSQCKVVLR